MSIRWLTIFLDFPGRDFGAGVAFWREVTGSELSPYRGEAGEFATLLPSDGDAYLRVQRISEGIGGCHLDLHVDLGDAGKPAPGTACPLTSTSPARPPSDWPNSTWRWAVRSSRCFLPGWRWPIPLGASTV
jgi:Glyoxalase-like domain